MTPAAAATIASASEAMCSPGNLSPALDASLTADWTLIEHITAKNALLGAQAIGLGERVYFGFLAQSKTDPTLFIAVHRGTNPTSIMEWLEDGLAPISNHIHLGFKSIHDTMECGIPAQSVADGISARVPLGATVICIGHSLGSPLAAFTQLALRKMNVNATGIFFACPKPGDALFAALFDELVGPDNYRVWDFSRDKVPDMPFTLWPDFMYAHLNSRTVIVPSQSTVEIPDDLANNHHAENYAKLLANLKEPI
jgi:triacylglycerol lipase